MSDDIRSFEGINPVAGNSGAKDSFGRNLARELNRTGAQERERRRLGESSSYESVANSMSNFVPTPTVSGSRFGSGLNVDAFKAGLLSEGLDYG